RSGRVRKGQRGPGLDRGGHNCRRGVIQTGSFVFKLRPELSKVLVAGTLSLWPAHGANTVSDLASIPLPYVLAAAALTALGAWVLLAPRRAARRGVMRREGNRTAVHVIGKDGRSSQQAHVLNR